ncbi:MAG: hypothetical protein ACUVRL_09875 [Candidatus Saccharicenans sp.]|uniref:hypothetical protein n=1 Tax=Candidatus Saccharicenans sp. TaxID=2819258 RepID=UPI00404945C0
MNNSSDNHSGQTPLDLENLYNQTLSGVSMAVDDREKVGLIANFFRSTRHLPEDLTYSYHLQLASLFFFLTASFQPDCLPPEELEGYVDISWELFNRFSDRIDHNQFRNTLSNLFFYLALNYFYLGELEEGLRALHKKQKIAEAGSLQTLNQELGNIGPEASPQLAEIKTRYDSNQQMFLECIRQAGFSLEPYLDLDLLQEKWKKYSGWSEDSLFCPLVERGGLLQENRQARLLLLESRCRRTGTAEGHNLVRFANLPAFSQEKSYLLATDALEAADYLLKKSYGLQLPPCTLVFSFSEKNFIYSGESLGLPLAVLALSQKLVASERRFHFQYSQEAAFTGKVDMRGEVLRISPEALELKVKAVFYSGLRYLVVPSANLKEARGFLYSVLARHPWRKLELIGVDSLKEILGDSRLCRKVKTPLVAHLARTMAPLIRRGFLIFLGLGIIIASFAIISKNPSYHFWKIRHPVVIELHNSSLFARNPDKQLLWVFPLPRPFRPDSLQQKLRDLEGDGEEEILVSGDYLSEEKVSSELFCLKKSGKLLWSYRPGRKVKTLTDEFSNHFLIKRFETADFNLQSREKSILLIANHVTWYPTQILLLNSTGKLLGEYWHAGHLGRSALLIEDLDEDGWKEIIVGGTNNDFQQACLLVLDPRNISGCSPSSGNPDFQFADLQAGTQEYYLLLPRTTINQTMGLRNYTVSIELFPEEKILEVTTHEFSKEGPCQMMYNFDFKFTPLFSRPTDMLTEAVKELVMSRVLPPHAETELRSLKDRIKYWDGRAWVTTPTRNKKPEF